ncbi:MAG: M15 family metallopeptidase [Chitinophagaceae bacterium]|nr:M15 family metallopeptidase [Chitinophagaceae bacterium]
MINNIRNRFRISRSLLVIFLTITSLIACGQAGGYTRPAVTDNYDDYKKQVKSDPAKKMLELKRLIPTIIYDLRYASLNNFMKRLMYPAGTNITFLRAPAANALAQVQSELNQKGLGLKIFDAYRPYSVTVKFWELVKDERYVANPSKGSGHNRGTTVDVTIINLQTKSELNMGTDFDNFSDTAHHEFTHLPEDILQNRILLKTTMERHGFKPYNDEWWHYSFFDGKLHEILDIDFKKLKKAL